MSDDEIKQEVLVREQRLVSIDREIASLEFRLKEFKSGKFVRSGEATLIRAAESFRRNLRADLQRKRKHRELIVSEIKKARERLEMSLESRSE